MKPLGTLALIVLLSALAGCAGKPSGDDTVLATVGTRTITQKDLVQAYTRAAARGQEPLVEMEARRTFLNDLVNKELMELAAFEAFPQLLPAQERRFLRTRRSELTRLFMERLVGDQVQVTEKDKDLAYERLGREVFVHAMLLPSEEMARQLKVRLDEGADFKQVALEYSIEEYNDPEDPSAMGYIHAGAHGIDLEEAVWGGSPGDVVGPFWHRGNWYIMQVGPSIDTPLPQERAEMDQQLDLMIREPKYLDRQRAVLDSLQAAANPHTSLEAKALLMLKYYWEPPPGQEENEYAFLDANRIQPTFTPEEAKTVVVEFDNVPDWTAEEFAQRLEWYPFGLWPRGQTIEQLDECLKQVIRDYLTLKAAEDYGLDKDPGYVASMEQRAREMRVNYLYYNVVLGDLEVTEDDALAWFEENRERYKAPPSYKIAYFSSRDRDIIDLVRTDWLAGSSFGQLRDKYRDAAVDLEAVGETPFIYEGQDPSVDAVVDNLALKGISEVFMRADVATVFQLLTRRGERLLSYAEIKDTVGQDAITMAKDKRLVDFLAAQREKYGVEVNEEALQEATIPVLPVGDQPVDLGNRAIG